MKLKHYNMLYGTIDEKINGPCGFIYINSEICQVPTFDATCHTNWYT